jgi:hypothetical protein
MTPEGAIERDRVRTPLSDRRAATVVGILYLVGDVFLIASVPIAASLLTSSATLADVNSQPWRLELGALFMLVPGFALAMIPLVLFPILRRYSERLAVGIVVFRSGLETVIYLVMAATWLLLVRVADAAATASGPDAAALASVGHTLRETSDVFNGIVGVPGFVIYALMLYWLFYTSRLIPRWLSVWGLVGAVLYLLPSLLELIDISWGFLMAPLGLQEVAMAIWLIAKGFATERPEHSTSVVRTAPPE